MRTNDAETGITFDDARADGFQIRTEVLPTHAKGSSTLPKLFHCRFHNYNNTIDKSEEFSVK
jgi:hypothetical protein